MKQTFILLLFLMTCNLLFGQNRKITGVVTSAPSGESLPGVTITEQGTRNGVITDLDGQYSIVVTDSNSVLSFSYVGFLSEHIIAGSKSQIDVSLVEDITELETVVVIGYGQQKKSDVSTSMVNVSSEKLSKAPVASIDRAFQGAAAGVQVNSNSGAPGSSGSVRIRGIGSLNYNEPLYVIDGVIVSGGKYSPDDLNASPFGNQSGLIQAPTTTNILSTINPNDIESINVLKDAAATAIYGSRGGNGVIIITTKRGKKGRLSAKYSYSYGKQIPINQIDLLNAKEYAKFSNDARIAARNDGASTFPKLDWTTFEIVRSDIVFSDSIDWLGSGTNWQEVIFRRAPVQSHQLSFTGGTEKVSTFFSAGYMDQKGIVIGTDFKRYSIRTNVDTKINDWINAGMNLTASSIERNEKSGVVSSSLYRSPTLPVYAENGVNYGGPTLTEASAYLGQTGNPLRLAKEPYNFQNLNRILGNGYVNVNFLKDFNYKMSVGIDYSYDEFEQFTPSYVEYPNGYFSDNSTTIGIQSSSRGARYSIYNRKSLLWENTLNYSKLLFEKHNVNLVLGYTVQKDVNEMVYAESSGHRTNKLRTVAAGDATTFVGNQQRTRTAYISYLGRLQYDYNSILYVTTSLRRDGNSIFGENSKFGLFSAVSGAFKVTGLPNFKTSNSLLSDLKLRISYGVNGVDGALGPGLTELTLQENYSYIFNNQPVLGSGYSTVVNKDLHWERSKQTDYGLDVGLFRNKILINFDYFIRRQDQVLVNEQLPDLTGIISPVEVRYKASSWVNTGEINNDGFDFSIIYRNYDRKFKYDITFNLSHYENEVVKLARNQDFIPVSATNQRYIVGKPMYSFWGYKASHIITDSSDIALQKQPGASLGDIAFEDINKDSIIDESDQTVIGNALPNFTSGLNISLQYRGFDFSIYSYASIGNEILNLATRGLYRSSDGGNRHADMVNRYPYGTEYPRAHFADPNNNNRISDRFVEDGSYFRINNIELGYELPDRIISKLSLSQIRLYGSLQNWFTFTNYSGYSPDIGTVGVDNTVYPNAKSWTVGLVASF